VSNFVINIQGYNKPIPEDSLKLKKGGNYSRERLLADVAKVRDILKKDNYLAPELDEPRVTYDTDTNTIAVELTGKVGATVKIVVESDKVGGDTQTTLLPVKREGTLDYSAIVEGERRLENYFQEHGYFFADVTPVCSVRPPISDTENTPIPNESEFLCSYLGGEDLSGREVEVKYKVNSTAIFAFLRYASAAPINSRSKTCEPLLRSQEANILGIIPLLVMVGDIPVRPFWRMMPRR
jgi:outer membrane protein assembly factor BamA